MVTTNLFTTTIYALATAPGRSGVAVVRISGPQAGSALAALTGRTPPAPRRAVLTKLRDPRTGDALDDALVLRFTAPASFTGEDVVELHLHGGRAVVTGVIEALAILPGLRLAEPGEFTRRAFENGKLDLTEAEAVADLIDAETTAQRRQALRQMEGALGKLYDGWRERLTRALAHIEADIDFAEDDLPGGVADAVRPVIAGLANEIATHLDDGGRGERLREGLHIAIVGAPNAGKSSLLNALARRDAAIVSARAGTTRDIIEVHLDLGGYPVVLADTAGLREAAADEVEEEGIRRARDRAARADVKVAVFDATTLPDLDPATLDLIDADTVVVFNKTDLATDGNLRPGLSLIVAPILAPILVSAHTGAGLKALEEKLTVFSADRLAIGSAPSLTRARHRAALMECRESLLRALDAPLPELAAEDVRLASRALGRITGRVDVEDLLDVIFQDFCIGK
ncbi:tRNA uridine-5-carboxymethylaminomethyl(34) synthesis GTPase MnmE [Azospirillum oryzae]|uniref:tRNA modification GTPase MnmE n=1 Tax=Azospirillum oryzae TaxID=286727 RepID=A0A6N1AIL0_9PROT|nr:tRNA uridine-5-carboxymethylaminomethyl(34) synthesis GTPase MnmE [Azospirillum oryzae]KAA0586051.1 tRNA uridine-5-carboxymethylaminomethyl(34) synthesis GTPase MnmE [Azospirillum oryzae]QKS50928.1 tRNA uridine-5-carboxymethylaminomethyl(34) synthesis GTPase MnmE [Azospirillum oryzae]GLR79247.1 tRNA modification GTPase MnmE [Azospirillum oryzae]